jgi:hypothetical protein
MIETLISSKTRIKLLLKFFLNSKNTAYLRGLEDKFEKSGFLKSFAEGNKKVFTVNTQHPLFSDLNKIILKMVGLEYVIDYILQRIGDLEKVYLVGNLSKGQSTDIIDLVLVGNTLNKTFLTEQIEKAEKKINKKIKYIHFTADEFNLNKIKEPGMHPLLLWSK